MANEGVVDISSELREAVIGRPPQELAAGDTDAVADSLRRHDWLADNESVEACGPAGEGNMNLTLRVSIRGAGGACRTVILKQSRGHVEKYPSIPAPAERVASEHGFYAEVAALESADRDPIQAFLPTVRGFVGSERLLLLEDLGEASDLGTVYDGGHFQGGELEALGGWLGKLHGATAGAAEAGLRDNGAMRELNAEHLFDVPLSGVKAFGMDLEDLAPGLDAAAAELRRDVGVREAFQRAKAIYLAPTGADSVLLHGDFYPGSWLRTATPGEEQAGVKVIDPEFCFHGRPEVDAGIALGHLALAARSVAEAEAFLDAYGLPLEKDTLRDFAGVEVVRRLIGVAQLPLAASAPRIETLKRAGAALSAGDGWRSLFS